MPRTDRISTQERSSSSSFDPHFSTNPSNIVAAMESAAGGNCLPDGSASRTHCASLRCANKDAAHQQTKCTSAANKD